MLKYKILIADDHAMVRDGIKTLLSRNKQYVIAGEAVNGREAIEKYKALKPDLVILDISMPDLNGMEAAKEIITQHPKAKIIILSMYDDEHYISKCIEYGVKGFVIKNETANELDSAIKTVLADQNYFSPLVQKIIVKKYTSTTINRDKKEQKIKLTTREIEIVKLISAGLTSHQMADKLFISQRTVETHRANLLKKVGATNSIELLKILEKLEIE
jgi:DNA-binding NarL/FixJ family response regulator